MSTVEMEVFSNTQLVLLTILMFCGGEVFMSILGLQFRRYKIKCKTIAKVSSLGTFSDSDPNPSPNDFSIVVLTEIPSANPKEKQVESYYNLKSNSLRVLSNIIICYLLVAHMIGFALIYVYVVIVPNAKRMLEQKDLSVPTFSVFTVVSTFANCGFLPNNESTMAFNRNSGLLLILIPQILMGNTLFPVFLHSIIRLMDKVTNKDVFGRLLKESKELGYGHLFTGVQSLFLGATVVGFVLVQFVVFCLLEWNSETTSGLSAYEKLVASLFQVVNVRHAGESAFDVSAISPAMLVIFVVMMYLPPYTSFIPIKLQDENNFAANSIGGMHKSRKEDGFWEHILFSRLFYLVIFTILICVTEREKMKKDPLNFNVFNIVIEVISAYGNVGFSMGYSCERRIMRGEFCKDSCIGFVGRWSRGGKFLIIVVMFFGKLKKFNL